MYRNIERRGGQGGKKREKGRGREKRGRLIGVAVKEGVEGEERV